MEGKLLEQRHLLPHEICEVENDWIPLSDGTRLAARYWLPENAVESPVPAILEYIPYRKRDHTKVRDETMHRYFAGHGYCAIRVDMRGSGDSDGVLLDEYLIQEQDDALEVIEWIAAQPWCTGRVGMMGKSWGGFNSLQVAARNPSALKCIMTYFSSVDRFADDIHYMGGCLLTMNPEWSFTMLCRNAQPPDPRYVGTRWREIWKDRLEANYPWITSWLKHQRRDVYWKHGSVCEDYSAIKCPVYAIGGWSDAYSNAVPRLLEGLRVPCKGVVGPWGHHYPHLASPGPQIDILGEALRWWDHWLKGIDTGLMDEPRYRVWMQDSVPPSALHYVRPGRWVAERCWPSPRAQIQDLALTRSGLALTARDQVAMTLKCPPTVGMTNLHWNNKGTHDGSPEDPEDQRIDDCRSLCFDSAPLPELKEILGAPCLTLALAVDRPLAFVCVRLCDVAPDGASTRVTYGLYNLALDPIREKVVPTRPGERRLVEVRLNDVAHRFAAGNRIRVSISTAFWPIVWPSPQTVTLTLFTDGSRLHLPIRPPSREDSALRHFAPPTLLPCDPVTVLRPGSPHLVSLLREIGLDRITLVDIKDSGLKRVDGDGWEFGTRTEIKRSITEHDPLSAQMTLRGDLEFRRAGELDVRIAAECTISSDRNSLFIEASLNAYDDGKSFFAKAWSEQVPRETV